MKNKQKGGDNDNFGKKSNSKTIYLDLANKSINSSIQASSIKTLNNDDINIINTASRNNFAGRNDSILRHNSDITPECLTNRTNNGDHKTNASIDLRQDSIMSHYSKKFKKEKKETQLRPFATKMIKVNRLL